MTEPRFAFQLYSLREVDDPIETVIGRVGDAEIPGVEFADAARAHGVDWVVHEAEGDADSSATLEAAATVGRNRFGG
ncbi:hypothetical protein [Halobaculum rubrum]|uniref:hypothetical protein n=1 Tax=Halobaculum rubrum TaxID=2872158 RepID=UPI001CA3FD43|nr:hypothetical protein [Halobaculum rubrum]QZX99192.1 hypothetical protein K6T25_13145 [Halobaculum rubrum]